MKIILFSCALADVGGAERLLFEHSRFLKNNGDEVYILTFRFNKQVLFGKYDAKNLILIGNNTGPTQFAPSRILKRLYSLRKLIKALNPDVIIAQSYWDCGFLYPATILLKTRYLSFIHGTMMWFAEDEIKYSFIHRKQTRHLRQLVFGHQQFYPAYRSVLNAKAFLKREAYSIAHYLAVRKAKSLFTLSHTMANEVRVFFRKNPIVVKGAYDHSIFTHIVKHNLKNILGLNEKRIILNVNRLDKRKRVDLLIKAFATVQERIPDTYLVICGVGEEDTNLKSIVADLKLDRVIFLGYAAEDVLLDYYATCDLFAHPNWADYALTVYEALALGKKVLCTSEMDFDNELLKYSQIFKAGPNIESFSKELLVALDIANTNPIPINILKRYTWRTYFEEVGKSIADC